MTTLQRQSASCFPMSGTNNGLPLDPRQNWTYISMSVEEICTRFRKVEKRRITKKRVVKLLLSCKATSQAYTEYVESHQEEIDDILTSF